MSTILIVNMPKEYDGYFKDAASEAPSEINISYPKHFGGGIETAEIVIMGAAVALPSLVAALKAVLKHIQEMKRLDKENLGEIIISVKKSDVEVDVAIKSESINKDTDVDALVDTVVKKASKAK